MWHDEKTEEIQLPVKNSSGKGSEPYLDSQPSVLKGARVAALHPQRHWYRDLDLSAPWVLRLVAVIAIMILGMLVF